MAAFGWDADDLKLLEFEAHTGAEPIRSLGYDGPLAALSRERQNLADFYKETVAVVTNPAIDREREIEHFSTRTVLGPRPSLAGGVARAGRRVELQTPLLLGGHRTRSVLPAEEYRGWRTNWGLTSSKTCCGSSTFHPKRFMCWTPPLRKTKR